ncbi:unnamed protein product, partial [Mesorhabditis belari]|uniref:Ig-like domain-containing protein n=1 Tax=Mesorhabditis belari TaxID=2138241 RepID=A0AAF3J8Y6_9BILA
MISFMATIQSITFCLLSLLSASISSVDAISVHGSPSIALNFKGTKSSNSHPIPSQGPITLWCATEGQKILSANFTRRSETRGGVERRHIGVVNERNATWTINHPTILEAGVWECRVETQFGVGTFNTQIYARPVAQAEEGDSYSEDGQKDYQLQSLPVEVSRGQSKNITCPALGHPVPTISWSKDGHSLDARRVNISGNTIMINNASEQNVGVYTCQAMNEFSKHRYLLVIKKELKLKSDLAWIVPLAVIFVILCCLVTVIFLCEIRRKKNEKKRAESEVAILED